MLSATEHAKRTALWSALGLSSFLLAGCAGGLAAIKGVVAGPPEPVLSQPSSVVDTRATPAAPVRLPAQLLRVSQSATQRDFVSGSPVFYLCDGRGCGDLTPKTAPRMVAGPGPTSVAPGVAAPATPAAPRVAPAASKQRGDATGAVVARIAFAYNRAELSASARAALDELAPKLARAESVRVVGLADTVKRDEANQALAQRRARAVADYLTAKWGGAQPVPRLDLQTRLVRVTEDGRYPDGEPHKGRRADVIELEID